MCFEWWKVGVVSDTVDGRDPANHLVDSLSHYLQGFRHTRWLAGFLPSTVVMKEQAR